MTSDTATVDGLDALLAGARGGDRRSIAKVLTLVESGGAGARAVSAAFYACTGNAITVGITGAPGAGKSTLTNGLIAAFRTTGRTVGVLAIDPSSPFSGGAILGDRVRMQDHGTDDGVFIRSMATRGHLGGLATATPQSARVLDALGFDVVVIETVGVGQVEVEIASLADTTVVVVNPGWGDSIQAAKAGLMEIADVFVVNKADRAGAAETVSDLRSMLHLAPRAMWSVPIVETVATSGVGVEALAEQIDAHVGALVGDGALDVRRATRTQHELRALVIEQLARRADTVCVGPEFEHAVARVTRRMQDPFDAADGLTAATDERTV